MFFWFSLFRAKNGRKLPKKLQRSSQDGPGGPQKGAKTAQERFKTAQEGPCQFGLETRGPHPRTYIGAALGARRGSQQRPSYFGTHARALLEPTVRPRWTLVEGRSSARTILAPVPILSGGPRTPPGTPVEASSRLRRRPQGRLALSVFNPLLPLRGGVCPSPITPSPGPGRGVPRVVGAPKMAQDGSKSASGSPR